MSEHTRRNVLGLAGAAIVGGVGVASNSRAQDASDGWTTVESPTTKTLHGVVDTAGGPFAVGVGGDVVA
ncbi:hypothetical protein ACFQE1_15240, partial [Halobium palmae]